MKLKQTQLENEAADGLSDLTVVLGIAANLRQQKCGEISRDQCNDDREAAAVAIELLADHIRHLEAWQQRGEGIAGARGAGIIDLAFSLGGWWADRPWHNRGA